jgi:hypothetical protein
MSFIIEKDAELVKIIIEKDAELVKKSGGRPPHVEVDQRRTIVTWVGIQKEIKHNLTLQADK